MAKAASARAPVVVRFRSPGPNIEGTSASYVFATKTGRHQGYDVAETPNGVELRKEGKTTLVPWSLVQQIEYVDA